MSRIHFFIAFATVSLLNGCSLFSSEDKQEPADLVKFEASVDLDRVWSNRVGDQGDEELYIRLLPVIADDRIYAASADGDVTAMDRISGKELWDVDTDVDLISAVGAGDGLVLVGSVDGILIALEQTNGQERWRKALTSEMLAAAQAEDGIVLAQSIDGKVVGLDTQTGEKRWQYSAVLPSLTLRTCASPLVQSGVAYIAFANGKIVALDISNGLQLWEQQVTLPEGRSELERIIDFDGQPILVGDDLYVASYQGRAAMIDRERGQMQWAVKISARGQLAAGNGNLYLTQPDDTVIALKMATGRRLWENSQLSYRQVTSPAVIGEYVAVADFDGYIHLLNQTDGQFAGRYSLWWSEGVRNSLFSSNGILYVLANSGKITALTLDQ